jgi:hypothetical protein
MFAPSMPTASKLRPDWKQVGELYSRIGGSLDALPPGDPVGDQLHEWQQLIDVRRALVETSARARFHDRRVPIRVHSASQELRLVDDAIKAGGAMRLRKVLQRVRDVRLVWALRLLERVLAEIKAGAKMTRPDLKRRVTAIRVSLLVEVGQAEFLRALNDPNVRAALKVDGEHIAALEVLESVGPPSKSTISRALKTLRSEFEIA